MASSISNAALRQLHQCGTCGYITNNDVSWFAHFKCIKHQNAADARQFENDKYAYFKPGSIHMICDSIAFTFGSGMDHNNNKASKDSHYKKLKIEPIDYARENNLDVYESKIVKYVSRAPFKGKQLDDLEKARNILDMLIEKVKQGYMPLRGRDENS